MPLVLIYLIGSADSFVYVFITVIATAIFKLDYYGIDCYEAAAKIGYIQDFQYLYLIIIINFLVVKMSNGEVYSVCILKNLSEICAFNC